MTIYCYDTEFLEDGKTIELISIGIVCEDGREYYAVNHDMPHDRISRNDWLCQNVVPHLPLRSCGLKGKSPRRSGGGSWLWSLDDHSTLVKPKWVIANEVREFLLQGVDLETPGVLPERPELWAYYTAYDHVALTQLWGRMVNLPKGIPMYTRDLKQEMDRLRIGSDAVSKPENEHDALADARWNMAMLHKLRAVAAGAAEVPF